LSETHSLTNASAEKSMHAVIKTTAGALHLSTGQAARILISNKWNVDASILAWLDKKTDTLYGVSSQPAPAAETSGSFECPLCIDSVSLESTFALSCGHRFCRPCWSAYLDKKVEDNLILHVTCCESGCQRSLFSDEVAALGSEATQRKFHEALFRSFVDNSEGLFWCKNPKGCKGIVEVDTTKANVTCDECHFTFCARCEYSAHAPASCSMMKSWDLAGGYQDLSEEESAVRKLKLETTRPCPKCNTSIEKNGGCPHMTCVSWFAIHETCRVRRCRSVGI
jgi:ariadne-1